MLDCKKHTDSGLISLFSQGVDEAIGCIHEKYGRYFYINIFPILKSFKNPEAEVKDCIQNYYLKLLSIKKEDRSKKMKIDLVKNNIKSILNYRIKMFAIDYYRTRSKKENNKTDIIDNLESRAWDSIKILISQQNMETINRILGSEEEIEFAEYIADGFKRMEIEKRMGLAKDRGRVLQQKIKRKLKRANIKYTHDLK